jgi:hypothetical protein
MQWVRRARRSRMPAPCRWTRIDAGLCLRFRPLATQDTQGQPMKLVRYGQPGAERPGMLDAKACCAICPCCCPTWAPRSWPRAPCRPWRPSMPAACLRCKAAAPGLPGGGRGQDRVRGPELCRPRAEGRPAAARRARAVHESHDRTQRPERRGAHSTGPPRPTGRWNWASSSAPGRSALPRRRPCSMWQAMCWPTMCPSAPGRWSAAASGTRARATTPLPPSALAGDHRRDCPTRTPSACGWK